MSRAYPGDEVFFHHRGEPKTGRVVCTGKTGCVVECKGEQHRLKWHNVSGFKKRALQDYRVIDHGEDGVIVENQHGKRSYMRIPPESRDDQLKLSPRQVHGVHNPTP